MQLQIRVNPQRKQGKAGVIPTINDILMAGQEIDQAKIQLVC